MSSDDELDELLRLTEEPLSMRGDREGELLDELLGDLAKGEIVGIVGANDSRRQN